MRKAALDGRTSTLRLSADERELAFYDGPVQLTSPIGARLLKALYHEGRIKLKKPSVSKLPTLDAYIKTEAAFRAEAAHLLADEDAKRQRLAEIIKNPACARADELSPYLIDKVITAQLGHGAYGSVQIAGLTCHKILTLSPEAESTRPLAKGKELYWWLDGEGHRQGDAE
ncbi:MAG: hypothetical protein WCC57_08215 [Paracoccaceae bacterium]